MSAKTVLTGLGGEGDEAGLEALLARVGLELWQTGEGFWAIRVKPAVEPKLRETERRAARRSR